jgi:membrane fusion protein (multidrug efflux system)
VIASPRATRSCWPGIAAGLTFLVGCADPPTNQGAAGAGKTAPAAVEVVTAAAKLQQLGIDIEAVGTARAIESAQITPKVSSLVSAIRFREGEAVRRGAVLVELEGHAQQAAVHEAEAALAQTEAQLVRGRTLQQQQIVSASQLELMEAAVKGDRARLEAARARLADTVIRAGFDGHVGFRHVSVGSLVAPGDVITTLDDLTLIEVDFTVPEGSLFLLERGLAISATTPGLPGRIFDGKVTALDPRIDVETRSIAVHAQITNSDGVLRPGMFMNVNVHTAPKPAVLVPEEAIIPEQGNSFVLVVGGDVVERRKVRTGRRRPGEVEIVSGLVAAERVVIRGVQNVRSGSVVREAPTFATTSPAGG